MTATINNWTEAFVVLRQRAEAMRGFFELEPGTSDSTRWPRTTGADVLAIVALVDPHVARLRSSHGAHGMYGRWRACVDDVGRHALGALGETYVENRRFWNCLAAVFVYLASVDAPSPDPNMWEVLVAELGHVLALRNIGPKGDGPFKHFPGVKTFHELYLEQYKYLRDLRGVVAMDPEPGMGGGNRNVPKMTNADVVQLADYWSKQLADVKRVMGRDDVEKQWNAARVDVDRVARTGDPNALYPKSNGFFRALIEITTHVSVADESPTTWDMAIDSLKDSVKRLPDNVKAGAKRIASGAGELAGDIAQGVGKVANQAGQGLFSGFGTPLLIGGGLIGLYLVSRARKRDEEAA